MFGSVCFISDCGGVRYRCGRCVVPRRHRRRRGAIYDARMTDAATRRRAVAVAVSCGAAVRLCPAGAPGVTSGAPTFRRVSGSDVSLSQFPRRVVPGGHRRRRGAIYDARMTDAATRGRRFGCGGLRCGGVRYRCGRCVVPRRGTGRHKWRPYVSPPQFHCRSFIAVSSPPGIAAVGAPFMTPG